MPNDIIWIPALVVLSLCLGCEPALPPPTDTKIPFPPKTCEADGAAIADGTVPNLDLTLATGSAETLAEQYQRPRYVNYFPPRTFSQMSELREERWKPEGAKAPTKRGTYEVTVFPCDDEWTSKQEQEANELIEKTREAAEKNGWFDYDKAAADGFHPMMGISDHYVHDEFANDGRILDPERPEFLMYSETPEGMVLTGVMYVMPGIGLRGPQIGGAQTIWHYHIMPAACYVNGIAVEVPDAQGNCSRGVRSEMSPEMVHVWFIERKNGPFSSAMVPPPAPESADEPAKRDRPAPKS